MSSPKDSCTGYFSETYTMPQLRRQNRGGGTRSFPSSSPMSSLSTNFTAPSHRTKLRRRPRPSSSSPSSKKTPPCPPSQRTVQLAEWSAAIEVIPNSTHGKAHTWPHTTTNLQRTSLFPADRDRVLLKKIKTIPRLSASLAPKTKYGTLKPSKLQLKPPKTILELKQLSERKRKKRLKTTRHLLEHEVLNLVACDIVGLSSTTQHKEMLTNATQTLRKEKPIDPYELPQTLLHRKHEKKIKPGPDPNLLDVRTHEKIFRTFVPFEQQWLDLWGSQNDVTSNCNAHCVRSIYKWNELKQKGRTQKKQERKKRKKRHDKLVKEKMKRNGKPKKIKFDSDMEKIINETNMLLRKPI